MRVLLRQGFLLAIFNFLLWGQSHAESFEVGMDAPDFSLTDQNQILRSLSDFRGNWLVMYFYPKDNTPGCTTEACRFRDDIVEFNRLDTKVVGISIDNTESHAEFTAKHSLPFPLLADEKGAVATQYGALWKLGPVRFAKRHTFIISPNGKISHIYRSVDPSTHSQQVVDQIKKLKLEENEALPLR